MIRPVSSQLAEILRLPPARQDLIRQVSWLLTEELIDESSGDHFQPTAQPTVSGALLDLRVFSCPRGSCELFYGLTLLH